MKSRRAINLAGCRSLAGGAKTVASCEKRVSKGKTSKRGGFRFSRLETRASNCYRAASDVIRSAHPSGRPAVVAPLRYAPAAEGHCYCTGISLPLDNTDLRYLMATHITVNCPQYKQRRTAFNYFGIIFHYPKKTKKQGARRPASPPRQVTRPAPRKYAAAQRCHLS